MAGGRELSMGRGRGLGGVGAPGGGGPRPSALSPQPSDPVGLRGEGARADGPAPGSDRPPALRFIAGRPREAWRSGTQRREGEWGHSRGRGAFPGWRGHLPEMLRARPGPESRPPAGTPGNPGAAGQQVLRTGGGVLVLSSPSPPVPAGIWRSGVVAAAKAGDLRLPQPLGERPPQCQPAAWFVTRGDEGTDFSIMNCFGVTLRKPFFTCHSSRKTTERNHLFLQRRRRGPGSSLPRAAAVPASGEPNTFCARRPPFGRPAPPPAATLL